MDLDVTLSRASSVSASFSSGTSCTTCDRFGALVHPQTRWILLSLSLSLPFAKSSSRDLAFLAFTSNSLATHLKDTICLSSTTAASIWRRAFPSSKAVSMARDTRHTPTLASAVRRVLSSPTNAERPERPVLSGKRLFFFSLHLPRKGGLQTLRVQSRRNAYGEWGSPRSQLTRDGRGERCESDGKRSLLTCVENELKGGSAGFFRSRSRLILLPRGQRPETSCRPEEVQEAGVRVGVVA